MRDKERQIVAHRRAPHPVAGYKVDAMLMSPARKRILHSQLWFSGDFRSPLSVDAVRLRTGNNG